MNGYIAGGAAESATQAVSVSLHAACPLDSAIPLQEAPKAVS